MPAEIKKPQSALPGGGRGSCEWRYQLLLLVRDSAAMNGWAASGTVTTLPSRTISVAPQDSRLHVLQAVFGIGLAMIGPGVWSADARLYGWRRLEIPTRKS